MNKTLVIVGKRIHKVEKLKKDNYDIIPILTTHCSIKGCRKKARYFINFYTYEIAVYVCEEHVKLFDNYPYK